MDKSSNTDVLYRHTNDTELSIASIFGKENLEMIQKKISKATGLAFVAVNYKGEPVTELTSFTKFCSAVRKGKDAEKLCRASDAFGAIQAAVTQDPYVYFCPCGLLEIAIPIIVKGQYLGGVIGGQIRCNDAPEDTSDLRTILRHKIDYKNIDDARELFESVPQMSYQQFFDFADLIHLLIKQVGEKEMSKLTEKEYFSNQIDILEEQRKRIEIENSLRNAELTALRAKVNPQFLLRSLSSVSNLAIIEDAPRTSEIVCLIADFFSQKLTDSESTISIKKEMDNIERYLRIQKIRLGDLINYSILIDEGVAKMKIPCLTILPFVEKVVFYGVSRRKEGGHIHIAVREDEDSIIVEIEDKVSMINSMDSWQSDEFRDIFEDEAIETGIFTARQIMISYFGREFDVQTLKKDDQSTVSILKYPKIFYDRGV